jgi:rRNA-processing protein FCF1
MTSVKVILDSNFLLVPVQFKVDIFEEIPKLFGNAEIFSLSACVNEAKAASRGKYKGLVEQLIALGKIKIIKAEGKVDDLLIEYGRKGYTIATNDKELRKKLDKLGIHTIFLRQRARIEQSAFRKF